MVLWAQLKLKWKENVKYKFCMICYLGLGSNLGDRHNFINQAKEMLSALDGVILLRSSTLIQTEPYGKTDQPDFINCVLEIETSVQSDELLKKCLEIEDKLGRKRLEKWGPRTIDIDMLFYGDQIINTELLTLPHPEIHKREFVLRSLNELCPDLVHPINKKKIKDIFMEIK